MNGIFTISLDFELHWGGFEKWDIEEKRRYFLNTREVIPRMLELFKEYEIHVTWATVGLLFHPNRLSLVSAMPTVRPAYLHAELSAYNYIERKGIGEDESDDPFHYAYALIKMIVEVPYQELGSHTFSHYYCQEEGQSLEEFRADLRAAQQSAQLHGKKLRSLVFPRNQFNERYLKICNEEGFVIVRDNPKDWFWNIGSTQNESFWKRANRGADAYLPIGNKNTYDIWNLPVVAGRPICLPASRLLRPYTPKESILNGLKIKRITAEMEHAAQKHELYHLWWHPHNFGHFPEQNIQDLKRILEYFSYCRGKWQMQSLNMGEVADQLMYER